MITKEMIHGFDSAVKRSGRICLKKMKRYGDEKGGKRPVYRQKWKKANWGAEERKRGEAKKRFSGKWAKLRLRT